MANLGLERSPPTPDNQGDPLWDARRIRVDRVIRYSFYTIWGTLTLAAFGIFFHADIETSLIPDVVSAVTYPAFGSVVFNMGMYMGFAEAGHKAIQLFSRRQWQHTQEVETRQPVQPSDQPATFRKTETTTITPAPKTSGEAEMQSPPSGG